jgi:hypothetical protein
MSLCALIRLIAKMTNSKKETLRNESQRIVDPRRFD